MAIIAISALIAYLALGGGLFEPQDDDIKDAVAAALRDPSSAEFRNIVESGETACGEVNGRNAFGAYTGFQKFVYQRGIVLFEPQESAGADIRQQSQHYEDVARFARLRRACHE